jgi:serine/threonine-protein kinase
MIVLDGRYEVFKQLSAGGFGITYLAKDLRRPGQPQCVVKQLRPQREFSSNEWQVARRLFDQEAEILERLGRHDQIPLLLAHFEENSDFFIVQDFIEGRTLRDELEAVRCLPEKDVITLLHQGLTVLGYVHQQGVIHRDIKPENLIRRQDGVICLIDFGIVKDFSVQHLGQTTVLTKSEQMSTTVSIGTYGYVPSEQGRGKPLPASDIYALGMVVIEALTGQSPRDFDIAPSTGEVIWKSVVQVSPILTNILTKMVRQHYSRRYANCETALKDLEGLLKPLSPPFQTVVASPQSPPESKSTASQDRQSWPNLLQLGGFAGIGLALLALGLRFTDRAVVNPDVSVLEPIVPTTTVEPASSSLTTTDEFSPQISGTSHENHSLAPANNETSPVLSPVPSDAQAESSDDFLWLSYRYVSESDLTGKTSWQLDVMRNSIFARHGRLFNNSKLQAYFNQKPWYQPIYMPDDFPNELISPVEARNAQFILDFQNQNDLRYTP